MSIIHQCSVISVVEKHLVAALPRCGLCGSRTYCTELSVLCGEKYQTRRFSANFSCSNSVNCSAGTGALKK
jgi:hypothetical protein